MALEMSLFAASTLVTSIHQNRNESWILFAVILLTIISGSRVFTTLSLLLMIAIISFFTASSPDTSSIVKVITALTWLFVNVQFTMLRESISPFGMITSAPSGVSSVQARM